MQQKTEAIAALLLCTVQGTEEDVCSLVGVAAAVVFSSPHASPLFYAFVGFEVGAQGQSDCNDEMICNSISMLYLGTSTLWSSFEAWTRSWL